MRTEAIHMEPDFKRVLLTIKLFVHSLNLERNSWKRQTLSEKYPYNMATTWLRFLHNRRFLQNLVHIFQGRFFYIDVSIS